MQKFEFRYKIWALSDFCQKHRRQRHLPAAIAGKLLELPRVSEREEKEKDLEKNKIEEI